MKLQFGFASILGLIFILCSFILDGYNNAEGAMVAVNTQFSRVIAAGRKQGMNVI